MEQQDADYMEEKEDQDMEDSSQFSGLIKTTTREQQTKKLLAHLDSKSG